MTGTIARRTKAGSGCHRISLGFLADAFLLINVVPHDDAYTWAAKRLYTVNTASCVRPRRQIRAA
jgi:hypothetical protein